MLGDTNVTAGTLHRAMFTLLGPFSGRVAFLPDFLDNGEDGGMPNDHRLGFVFISGDVLTLDLPM
ncbi:hypothetical protein L3055_05430 [Corynebacterium sp. MC-02]|nr:hypothetical protein [Corynebacterium pseudokroppenstedtii]